MNRKGIEEGKKNNKRLVSLVLTVIIVISAFMAIGISTEATNESSPAVTTAQDGKIPIIIILKDQYKPTPNQLFTREASVQSMKSFAEAKQKDLLPVLQASKEVKDIKQFWIVNAIACKATPTMIEEIKKRPDVAKVESDKKVYLLDSKKEEEEEQRFFKTFNVSQTIEWIHPGEEGIAWGVDWIEAPQVWASGIDGSGINVSVVDTGINASHPDLEGKVIAWKDFVNNETEPYDDHGHGTHCAGTVAGTGASGTKTGVAPGANLFGVKVFNQDGYATESVVIAGFEWSVNNGADVISYSGGCLPIDGEEGEAIVNASSTNTHTIQVNDMDSFKPAFICAVVESRNLQNLSISLIAPNETIVQGDYMDWLVPPDIYAEFVGIYKYSENKPLPNGNWSLNVTSLKTEENHVWYSGADNNLNNILSHNFNLSEVSNATLNFSTMYDIEDDYDNGYVEISTDGTNWIELARYTGHSYSHNESINLSEYAGENVTIRFRYKTDSSVIYAGWYIDNIEIPEIEFSDDVEAGEGNWTPDGWEIILEMIPYGYALLVAYPDNGTSAEAIAVNNIAEIGGVVPIIAAGNEGELGLRTINSPGSASKAITVGATDYKMDYIAYFSSRGPVGYDENETIKPDVVAPGVGIVSTWYEGGYHSMSGTSMATPHVAGTVALMLQANSSLNPAEVKQILKNSSFDLGEEGEDNTYGAGRADAYTAVSNVTALEPTPEVQLYAGCAKYYYEPNQSVTITAISWNNTAVSGTNVSFIVDRYGNEVLNTTNSTDDMGLATASFVPTSEGRYDITISDEFGNVVDDYIWVSEYQPSEPEERPFDTPSQSYVAMPNTTVQMKYTLITPDFESYNENVNLSIGNVVNVALTPVNGTTAYDLNLSEYDFDDAGYWGGSIYIKNETESIHAGYLYINPEEYVSELYPFYAEASPGDAITYLFQKYNYVDTSPAPDQEYTMDVYWLKEVEIKSLAGTDFELTNKLMCNEKMTKEEEIKLLAEIKDMGINYTSFNVTTANGIATFDVSVPEDVYEGIVEIEGEGYWYVDSYISVDMSPWSHHEAVKEDAELWIRADWDGEYDDVNRAVTPYDNFTVYVELFNYSTGEAIQNAEVYLYTEDEAKTVITDGDGEANTTFSISYNSSLPRRYNEMQVVGLYDGTWDYDYAYPPIWYPWFDIDVNIEDDVLDIVVEHKNHEGVLIDAPTILDVNEVAIWEMWWWESTGTPLSKYINESEHHETLNVDSGEYLIRDIWKIPGGWGWYSEYIANTPLEILTLISDKYLKDTTVSIDVHMKSDEAGVTVYIIEVGGEGYYYGYYEGGEFQYVDIATTDENGNATLYLKVPSKGYVDYIIGGSNTSYAFHAEYGTFEVTEEAKPDLVPEIDIPELILPGESAFNVTVYNRGTLESTETTMNIYVNNSLVNTTNVHAIGVGAYETFVYTYNFAEGSQTIKAVVDPDNLNDELNENNNVSETNIVAAAEPDLIGHIEVPQYIKKYKNDTVTVNAVFVIENTGTAATTRDFVVQATYEDTSADLTIEDTINAGDNITYRMSVVVGPEYEGTTVEHEGNNYTVTANGSIPMGDYTVGIYVDANNDIDELNETNNNATVTATVTRPDLVPMLTVPAGEVEPDEYNITAGVKNMEHVYAVPTQLRVVIENAGESEVYNQSFDVPMLDAIGDGNNTWNTNVTFNFVGGVYNVSVIANSNDSEAETDYTNNVITKKVIAVKLSPINVTVSSCYNVPRGETRNSSIVLEDINSTYPLGSLSLTLWYNPQVVIEAGNSSDYNVTMTTHHVSYNRDEVRITGSGLNLNGTITIANITFKAVDDTGKSSPLNLTGTFTSSDGFNIPMNVTDGVFTTVKITDLKPYIYCYPGMMNGTNNTINVYVKNLRHTHSDNFSLNVSVYNVTTGDFVEGLLNETYPGIPAYGGRIIPIVWNVLVPEGGYWINATVYNDTETENNNASRRVSVEEYKLAAHRMWYPWQKVRQNTTFMIGGYFRASHPGYVNASIELPAGLELASGENQNTTKYAWRSNWNSVWWRVKGTTAGEYGNQTDKMINITVEARGKSDTITTDESGSPNNPLRIWVPSIWVYSSNTTSLIAGENESNMTFKTLNVTTFDQKMKLVVQAGADGRRLSGLDYLVRYPYGCVEQVTSRMLGGLHTDEYYRVGGRPSGYNWDRVNTTIEMGVTKLAKAGRRGQHDNGAWSMWGSRPIGDGFYSMYASYGLGRVANDTLYGHLVTENLTSEHTASAAPGKFNFNDTIYWFNGTAHEGPGGSIYWTPWQGTHWFFNGHLPVTSWTMVSHYEMVNYCGVNASAKSVANETMEKVTKYLVDSQREDGGWNQWGGTDDTDSRASDAISTSLSVWGLKLYGMNSTDVNKAEIENAIKNGSTWLLENQQGDGHWANPLESPWWNNYGRRSEATAYALIALNESKHMEDDLSFESLNNTNASVANGVGYLIRTYRHHGSWGYTASTQASLHALTILQATSAVDTIVTIEIDGVVTKTIAVNGTYPRVEVYLNETEIGQVNNRGEQDPAFTKKKIHTVNVTRTDVTGRVIVSVENDQLVPVDELVLGDVAGHKILSSQDGIMSREIKGTKGSTTTMILTSLDEVMGGGGGGSSGTITVEPELPTDAVEGETYLLNVTIKNNNDTALISPIVNVPLGGMVFNDTEPDNTTYESISGSDKNVTTHEYDATNNTLEIFPEEIPPNGTTTVYFNATLPAGNVKFETRVTPMYNELKTFIGNTSKYVKGYGNVTVNVYNESGMTDAIVELGAETSTTAGTQIKEVEGTYSLNVTKSGYMPVNASIVIARGDEKNVTVKLYNITQLDVPEVIFTEGDIDVLNTTAAMTVNDTVTPNAAIKAARDFTVNVTSGGKTILAVKVPSYERGSLSAPLDENINVTNATGYTVDNETMYITVEGSKDVVVKFEGRKLGNATSVGDTVYPKPVNPNDAVAILQYSVSKHTGYTTDLWGR